MFSPTSRDRTRLRINAYDAVCAIIAPVAALGLRDTSLFAGANWMDGPPPTAVFIAIAAVSAWVSFLAFRLSDAMRRFFSVHDFVTVCGAVATTVGATAIFMFSFTRLDGIPRSTPALLAVVLLALLTGGRAIHRAALRDEVSPQNLAPAKLRNFVIVGADGFAFAAIRFMAAQNPPTARVVAILDERDELVGRSLKGVRVLASAHDLDTVLDEYKVHGIDIDQVLVSDRAPLSDAAREALEATCAAHAVGLATISEAFNLASKELTPAPAPAAASAPPPKMKNGTYFGFKRTFDIVTALVLIVALLPAIALVAILVLVDVGTPLLFWQERVGRGGRRFLLYKFRTYKAPYGWNGEARAPDERLSTIGRFIRATRFDEIPQLLNILIGDMSLIGPRPLLPVDQPLDPSARLLVRPGITGWAQVNGGRRATAEEKAALDEWYIQHASPLVDLNILAHSLIIAATGERFNRRAVLDALTWRSQFRASAPQRRMSAAKSSHIDV